MLVRLGGDSDASTTPVINREGTVTFNDLEAAFTRLFDSGEADKILNRLKFKYSGLPREDVIEMFQEACVEVVQRYRAGKDTSNVAGLVHTITRNKLADAVKSRTSEDLGDMDQLPLGGGRRRASTAWGRCGSRASQFGRGIASACALGATGPLLAVGSDPRPGDRHVDACRAARHR